MRCDCRDSCCSGHVNDNDESNEPTLSTKRQRTCRITDNSGSCNSKCKSTYKARVLYNDNVDPDYREFLDLEATRDNDDFSKGKSSADGVYDSTNCSDGDDNCVDSDYRKYLDLHGHDINEDDCFVDSDYEKYLALEAVDDDGNVGNGNNTKNASEEGDHADDDYVEFCFSLAAHATKEEVDDEECDVDDDYSEFLTSKGVGDGGIDY
ncbi:uncharacterized protein LOC126655314 [Mercurialis annua]|uniref:uncharacterized protein LOC126655314 n=1 Tax=Mercurialis annua TaxID=3986 RepID=UPI002160BC06|nr:uncharacterized protein LOC126655314 [Mercurialis annua]